MSTQKRNTMKKKATNNPQKEKKASSPKKSEKTASSSKSKKNLLSKLSAKKNAVFAATSAVSVVLYLLLINKFTICDKGISLLSLILVIAICFCGFVLHDIFESTKLKRFVKGMAAACLIALGAETLLFNFKSLASNNEVLDLGGFSGITSNSELTVIDNDLIIINGDAELYIDIEKPDIKALKLEFSGNEEEIFQCGISIKDNNFSRQFTSVGSRIVPINKGYCEFAFVPYEELHSSLISFTNVSSPITISSINFSKALPFRFSEIRFYFVFVILAIINAIRIYELYKVSYDRKNSKHRAIILILTALCSMTMFFFVDPEAQDQEYDPDLSYSLENPYIQMFDAFQNGRTSIDIEPSEGLLALENPYDDSIRLAEGVAYTWDRAYYNGKYYSYYGVAPVITFYYPHYFLTNKLPSINKTSIFFGMLTIVFMFGTIMAFIRKFIEKPNFLLVVSCLVASIFASGIYINVDFSNMYALPGVTGTCYLMMCLWCGFEACIRHGEKKQPLLFALCGIAFSLALASKPTRALSCLILAPLFLEIIFSKQLKLRSKITAVASFMIPVLTLCGAIMAYNNARFDSPFEFGAVYQLTVSNIQAGGLKLSYIPHALMHYLFQPIRMAGSFPFVEISGIQIVNRQSYVYSDFAAGALSVPIIAAGIIALPFLMHHLRRKKGEKLKFDTVNIKKATYIFMFIMSLFLAWFSYCVAGIIMSYVCDIMPLMTLLAVFVLIDTQKQIEPCHEISGKSVCLITCVAAATVIVMALELISFRNVSLHRAMPNLLFDLEEIISFWN